MAIHTYPVNDIRAHQLSGVDCHCGPDVEWIDEDTGTPYSEGPHVIHRSYDGREHR